MANITNALLIAVSLNVVLFLGMFSAIQLNPDGYTYHIDVEDTFICSLEQGNCQDLNALILNDSDPSSLLPSLSNSVDTTEGDTGFTDLFSGIKTFFSETLGFKYLGAIVSAPSTFFKTLGLGPTLSFALGALWYGITGFLIVAFLFGRDA